MKKSGYKKIRKSKKVRGFEVQEYKFNYAPPTPEETIKKQEDELKDLRERVRLLQTENKTLKAIVESVRSTVSIVKREF